MNTNRIEHIPLELVTNEDKLCWLMEKYGDMVIRLAYTFVKEKELSEDIAQEVFINCYKNLDRFEEKSSYQTWIYRITVNKCKDVLRSWSFRNIFIKENTKLMNLLPIFENFNLEASEEKEEIFIEILALPIKQREIIVLHYYEDLSIQEIATLLKINVNTVKTRLHRARTKLKGSFEKGEFSWKIN